jgi:hypothetical protein
MFGKKALAASVSAAPKTYVEDVFSTWLYSGNGGSQTITNGIDLSGKGGLVWIKGRTGSAGNIEHALFDTARGVSNGYIKTNSANPATGTNAVNFAFNSNGFSFNSDGYIINDSSLASTYASWTFRKAEKFFDVVTYTGNGSNRTISHNLGSVPGTIIVKRTDTTGDWQVYHRSLANTEYLVLNSTAAKATGTTRWNSTTPTSTVFSLGTDATVNANGGTYVAYLFAHDAGGFGDAGSDSVVSCGSFTADGSGNATVTLGWEPQWFLFKRTNSTGDWRILDTMRGWTDLGSTTSGDNILAPNLSNAETTTGNWGNPTATGFSFSGTFNPSDTYIYIAIRRGPMKTPTDATKVFALSTAAANTSITTGFPAVDLDFMRRKDAVTQWWFISRLTGSTRGLDSSSTGAEAATPYSATYFDRSGSFLQNDIINPIVYLLARAPGFFDVVAYTGTGSARTVAHNLGVAPELMIIKSRNIMAGWGVYNSSIGATNNLALNLTDAATPYGTTMFNSTNPTSSIFSVGTNVWTNQGFQPYIAYLFATLAGISKVGSYTGTGTTLNVDCGFTNGARFVLIKRTDSTGDWYVWDTARGIVSGNDPFLLMNSTAAENTSTDYIDPLSSGFQISSTAPAAINANGGSFIFLAIA